MRLYQVGDTHIDADGERQDIVSVHEPYTQGHSYPVAITEKDHTIINGPSEYKFKEGK